MHFVYGEALEVAVRTAWLPVAAVADGVLFSNAFASIPLIRLAFELVLYALPTLVLVIKPRHDVCVAAAGAFFALCVCKRLLSEGLARQLHGFSISKPSNASHTNPILDSFTLTKAGIALTTAAVLLVVDCKAFPKRFFKSGTYGASLMDAGVGCAAVSLGMSAARRYALLPNVSHRRALTASLYLIALAVTRLALTRAFRVGVDPAEYGVHWNFFATLAALPPAIHLTVCMTGSTAGAGVVGLAVLCVYQAAVLAYRLDEWMMTLPAQAPAVLAVDRHIAPNVLSRWRMCPSGIAIRSACSIRTLFDANRSGAVSTIGFIGIALVSVGLGGAMYGRSARRAAAIWSAALVASAGTYCACCEYGLWPSRRQANLPFAAFSIGLTLLNALLFLLASALIARGARSGDVLSQRSLLVRAVSSQQLFVFLAVNVAVGVLNVWDKHVIGRPSTIIAVALSVLYAISIVAHYLCLQK